MAAREPAVLWSPEGERDLLTLWRHLRREAGPEIADRHVHAIVNKGLALARGPFQGRPRDEIRDGLRSIYCSPHVIFYRVRDGAVEIVRVLHERQDVGKVFGGR